MKQINKTLGICLLVTALVYGVLKMLGAVGFGNEAKGDAEASSRDSITRHDRGENASDVSTRKFRQRARKMTSAEAREFLKTTIIPEINFENITLKDALKIFNGEIAKQTSDDQPRPKILFFDDPPKFRDRNSADAALYDLESIKLNVHLHNVNASDVLKSMCSQLRARFWLYKGNFYVSTIFDGGISDFAHNEKLSHVKLENIHATELASKLNEIIDDHDYFGPKRGINVFTTGYVHAALLKGEVQLPHISLDLQNVTLNEVIQKIVEDSGGTFKTNDQFLIFNPFNKELNSNDPSPGIDPNNALRVLGDENLYKAK